MVPYSILFFIMDYAYWSLFFKDFQPDNWPLHFRSSGVFILNLVGLEIMFIIDCSHKTIKDSFSFYDCSHKTIKDRFSFYDNMSYLIKVYRCSD